MGFTVPEIDKILEPYAQKTYDKIYAKTMTLLDRYNQALGKNKLLTIIGKALSKIVEPIVKSFADAEAISAVQNEMKQGFQGLEYKFNTVGSSRGDYPFITFTAGLATSRFGKMASITMFDVRRKGQGKKDKKRPVLFPKLVFLYDKEIHGEESNKGEINRDVFEAGLRCSSKTMYPKQLGLMLVTA